MSIYKLPFNMSRRDLIKRFNEHDSLVAEVERLTQENTEIRQNYNERLDDLEGVLHNMGKFNDRLKQENEDLITANTILEAMKEVESQQVNILEKQNEQLREALRKCIPFTACSNKANNVCEFCYEKEHKDDCEYIRLTKEAND